MLQVSNIDGNMVIINHRGKLEIGNWAILLARAVCQHSGEIMSRRYALIVP